MTRSVVLQCLNAHATRGCMLTCVPNALQSAGQLPEAFVVLGFAFYLQPMMMPLLHDMPQGPSGLAITSTAVKIVIIGTLPFVSYTEQVDENDILILNLKSGNRKKRKKNNFFYFSALEGHEISLCLRRS